MTVGPTTRIRDVITLMPAGASVLASYGLTVDVHGDLDLATAARATGLPVETLLHALEDAGLVEVDQRGWPVEWLAQTPEELVDYILRDYHFQLRKTLPALTFRLTYLLLEYGNDFPELYDAARLFEQLEKQLMQHCQSEEEILLPALRDPEIDRETVESMSETMRSDHSRIRSLVEEIRALTLDYPLSREGVEPIEQLYAAWRELETDTLRHLYVEENQLVPMVLARVKEAGN